MSKTLHTATWFALEGSSKWAADPSEAYSVVNQIKANSPNWPINASERDSEGNTIAHIALSDWPANYEADAPLAALMWALKARGVDLTARNEHRISARSLGLNPAPHGHPLHWARTRTALSAMREGFEQDPRREEIGGILGLGGSKPIAQLANTKGGWAEQVDGVDLGVWATLNMFDGIRWGTTMRANDTSQVSQKKIEKTRQKDLNAILASWKAQRYLNPTALALAQRCQDAIRAMPETAYGKGLPKETDSSGRGQRILWNLQEYVRAKPSETSIFSEFEGTHYEGMVHTLRYISMARQEKISQSGWQDIIESLEKSHFVFNRPPRDRDAYAISMGWESFDFEVVKHIPPTEEGANILLRLGLDLHGSNFRTPHLIEQYNSNVLRWVAECGGVIHPLDWKDWKANAYKNKHEEEPNTPFIEALEMHLATPKAHHVSRGPRL